MRQFLITFVISLRKKSRFMATKLLTSFLPKASLFMLQSTKDLQLLFTIIYKVNPYLKGSFLYSLSFNISCCFPTADFSLKLEKIKP